MTNQRNSGAATTAPKRVRKPKSLAGELEKAERALSAAAAMSTGDSGKALKVMSLTVARERIDLEQAALA